MAWASNLLAAAVSISRAALVMGDCIGLGAFLVGALGQFTPVASIRLNKVQIMQNSSDTNGGAVFLTLQIEYQYAKSMLSFKVTPSSTNNGVSVDNSWGGRYFS